MKKIHYTCLAMMLSFSQLMGDKQDSAAYAATSSSQDTTIECTECFLEIIGSQEVKAIIQNGEVKLSGPKRYLEQVIRTLTTPAELSQHFPLATNVCPQPQAGKVTSFDDFIKRLSIPTKDFVCFKKNMVSHDKDQRMTFTSGNDFEKIIINFFLDAIRNLSPFFRWMQNNFSDFLTTEGNQTIINYGLANKFVSCNMPSISDNTDDENKSNSEVIFSHQWFLERLIIANSGNVIVRKHGNDDYRLMIAHQGVAINTPTEHNITICLDLSGSMKGEPLQELKDNLPVFLRKLYDNLPLHMTLNIKIIGFDCVEFETHSLKFDKKEAFPSIEFIQRFYARFSTDLGIIGQHVIGGARMCIAFTDGNHNNGNLDMNKLASALTSGSFAKPFLCSVGSCADQAYFQKLTEVFGGNTCPKNSVKDFCNYVAMQTEDLLKPQVAYSLMAQLAQTFWIPSANGLYDTGVDIHSGGTVRATSGHKTVLKPTVATKKPAYKAPFKVTAIQATTPHPLTPFSQLTKNQKSGLFGNRTIAQIKRDAQKNHPNGDGKLTRKQMKQLGL